MHYHNVLPMSRSETESALASEQADTVTKALLSATYYDADWRWVEDHCLRLLDSSSHDVRGLVITCLGHLARIHGILDRDAVVPILHRLVHDPEVGGRAQDALDDVEMYVGGRLAQSETGS